MGYEYIWGFGDADFFSDLDIKCMYLLRKCAYRDIQHII